MQDAKLRVELEAFIIFLPTTAGGSVSFLNDNISGSLQNTSVLLLAILYMQIQYYIISKTFMSTHA